MLLQILPAVLLIIAVATLLVLLLKKQHVNLQPILDQLNKIDFAVTKVEPAIRDEAVRSREENQNSFKSNREELNNSFKLLGDTLTATVKDLSEAQKSQFDIFSSQLSELIKTFDQKINILQEHFEKSAKDNRLEQANSLKSFEEKFTQNVKDFNDLQKQKFDDLVNKQEQIKKQTEDNLKEIRETVEKKLQSLSEDNSKKLEEMRKTVDEKLHETVEKRFNESFKMISDRLEQVHKGLSEMQTLATGVGDLKKVLTNVKTRGGMGEIQLGAILEQIFSPDHYQHNAIVKDGTQERVEYVIKLPGQNDDNKPLLLPIDSKFPNEDYQRLIEAYDQVTDIDAASKQFENSVKKCAKDIKDKYINPPTTTDFAIMFVPTEGLYAEIIRRTGLFESLRRDYKITVVGPTNLVAFLQSLQMGFKTLAIQKRSSEVWEVLGAVKTEFGNFGDILEKTKKKLQEATNTIDKAGVRSRAIERKLRTVQELPKQETIALLGESIEIELDKQIDQAINESD